jgi:hypothetical protein
VFLVSGCSQILFKCHQNCKSNDAFFRRFSTCCIYVPPIGNLISTIYLDLKDSWAQGQYQGCFFARSDAL